MHLIKLYATELGLGLIADKQPDLEMQQQTLEGELISALVGVLQVQGDVSRATSGEVGVMWCISPRQRNMPRYAAEIIFCTDELKVTESLKQFARMAILQVLKTTAALPKGATIAAWVNSGVTTNFREI